MINCFVECRVGEPLTALALGKLWAAFGSASGYVGRVSSQEYAPVIYEPEVYGRIIRGIELQENEAGKLEMRWTVGDEYAGKVEILEGGESTPVSLQQYEEKSLYDSQVKHYSSHRIPMLKNGYVFLGYYPSPLTPKPCKNPPLLKIWHTQGVGPLNRHHTSLIYKRMRLKPWTVAPKVVSISHLILMEKEQHGFKSQRTKLEDFVF